MDNKRMSAIVGEIVNAMFANQYYADKLAAEECTPATLAAAVKHDQKFRGMCCEALGIQDEITEDCIRLMDELELDYWEASKQFKLVKKLFEADKFCKEFGINRPIHTAEAFRLGREAAQIAAATEHIVNNNIKQCFKNYLNDDGVVNKAYAFENYDADEAEEAGINEVFEEEPEDMTNSAFWSEQMAEIQRLELKLKSLHAEKLYAKKCIEDEIKLRKEFVAHLETIDPEVANMAMEYRINKLYELISKCEARCEYEQADYYRAKLEELKAQ